MTNHDVIYRHRLRALALASECGSVAQACRLSGIHRSTFYRWKQMAQRFGLEILRSRERRRPQMPNSIPALIEQRILAFSLGHPGLGPKRIAAELARPLWGGFAVSPAGVCRALSRHGLRTRGRRMRKLGARHTLIYPGRPQPNGAVERGQRTILEECWKPPSPVT